MNVNVHQVEARRWYQQAEADLDVDNSQFTISNSQFTIRRDEPAGVLEQLGVKNASHEFHELTRIKKLKN